VPSAPSRPSELRYSSVVRVALAENRPIVALESSVLAQGLPIPANAEAARRMARAVESRGAVPAITAVVRGVPTIGLEDDDLARFLRRDGIRKLSTRDLGAAIAQQADGATTVASSLALARLVGIEVLATGGIGGVHRRGPRARASGAIDESADLLEIERSPIVVVCAGAKAILDLPATLERLETLGIPVIGYRTSELPGFFTAETGLSLSTRVDSAEEIVAIVRAHRIITAAAAQPSGASGGALGILVVQPPPDEFAVPSRELEPAIERALAEAEEGGVRGAQVTPFLLEAVSRLTEGRSLDANLALLEQNAALAAEIAVVLHGVVRSKQPAEVRAGSSRPPNVHR
jgi:pseudouridylate synthase